MVTDDNRKNRYCLCSTDTGETGGERIISGGNRRTNRRTGKGTRKMGIVISLLMLAMTLAGCAETGSSSAADTQSSGAGIENAVNDKELKQAGLGALSMLYDDTIWEYDEADSMENSLTFHKGEEALIGISCSKESLYQHPLDMIEMSRQIYSTFEGYRELETPVKVEVNGDEWYEWSYCFTEDGVENAVTQRFYGKNYYAYTVSFTSLAERHEEDKPEAMRVLNSIVMSVPENGEAEAKAKKLLTGEWDMGASGCLVLNEDGTYSWYMQQDKDERNMHRGTYGCDVENADLGFAEGEGVYLVLFPEALYTDGEEGMTGSPKYDYAISLDREEDGSYLMFNISTFNTYSLIKK